MADHLNMNGLSLNESKHAPNGMPNGRSAYVPPHLRGMDRNDGPPAANPGLGGSAWGNTGYAKNITLNKNGEHD